MSQKRIQLVLNVIAGLAIFIFAVWQGIIWWQNPEWSQMMLFRHTWQLLVIMILLVLPAIVYDIYSKWDK